MSRLILLSALALLAVGCQKEIGDACQTNLDCKQDGTRECDLSQPGGYCTVFTCDEKTCPDDSVCIRSFATYQYATAPCQVDSDCPAEYLCLPDVPSPMCVRRIDSLTFCANTCGGDGDCRGGYTCLTAASVNQPATSPTRGNLALVNTATTTKPVRFCSPK